MRHQKSGKKLGRNSSSRDAMMRNMVTSLLEHERLETTQPKAKELRQWAEKMVTLGKQGGLHAQRRALEVLRSKDVAHKLFTSLAARYAARPGGYTRTYKIRPRLGDCAPMAIVELVDRVTETKEKGKKKKAAASAEGESRKEKKEKKKGKKAAAAAGGADKK